MATILHRVPLPLENEKDVRELEQVQGRTPASQGTRACDLRGEMKELGLFNLPKSWLSRT